MGVSQEEYGASDCGFRPFSFWYKTKNLNCGPEHKVSIQEVEQGFPQPKLEMRTWVNVHPSFLSPSGVCGKPVMSASTVLGLGGAMVQKTDIVTVR